MSDERTNEPVPRPPAHESPAIRRPLPTWLRLTLSGLAGAVTVTLLNEGVRRALPHAPRMDVIGERGLSKTLRATGVQPPRGEALYLSTMAADLASNSLYYALVGLGGQRLGGDGGALGRGAALGLAAGLGGAFLPPRLGLGHQPGETSMTRGLTVAWYTLGGVAAGAVYRTLGARSGTDLNG
ncbi:hypothetical protein [Deinococcus koreensis]|uniref:Uncharacterized protein n=1 Tax=Deinococcus koreensis TaxID=2054903 RepID=A0A2K3UUQ4_9DEIO|nr:hypothetical protein [Deinococcus koreensis]PNY80250.1 hypothetical protein CVO96_01735 [Deinococcus koreensis]